MVKNIITFSMIAALSLITVGCGGGGSSDSSKTEVDTTAPVITTATPVTVEEGKKHTLTLAANEQATFSIADSSGLFDLNGSALTFDAPDYDANGANEYNVTVTATDAANNSAEKVLSFLVTQTVAKAVVVPVGDKNLTVDGNEVIDLTGLRWLNQAPATTVNFADAKSYCEDAGYRLASRDELFNIIDFSKGDHAGAKLLEDELNAFTAYSESWADKIADKYLSLNFSAGADTIEANGDATRSVICVKGASAPAHTFTQEGDITVDQDTQLKWTSTGDPTDGNNRRAIDNNEAADYCANLAADGGNWRLPNINELRTLMQTSDHKVPDSIAPDGTTVIWSATEYSNSIAGMTQNYVLDLTGDIATIRSEVIMTTDDDGNPVAQKLFVTCVKNR